ncbi:MAG: nuclear transport factor 2 family protein [Parvibaculaceae bacterium]
MPQTFEEFLEKRRAAALAYVRGDARAVADLSARTGAATFFDPGGGIVEGAEAVLDAYDEGARTFGPESITELEIHDYGSCGEMGFWAGLQRATVAMKGRAEPVSMTLRVSEVFLWKDEAWRMVHRHASVAAP